MSGIVVLALLSGGIVIIMATVCLQRVGSKQYDLVGLICKLFLSTGLSFLFVNDFLKLSKDM